MKAIGISRKSIKLATKSGSSFMFACYWQVISTLQTTPL